MDKKVVEADGFKWLVGGPDTDDHLALGGHETALGPILVGLAEKPKAYINIGAHVGTWALRLSREVRWVWAIEANPDTMKTLSQNILINNLDNIEAKCWALWDNDVDLLTFIDVNAKATGGSTRLSPLSSQTAWNTHAVMAHKLDTVLQSNIPIGLISMDVEGAEAKILRGAKELINEHRPNMVIELHDGHPGTDDNLRFQVYDILVELDYEFFSIFVSPPEEHLVCIPKENALEPEVV